MVPLAHGVPDGPFSWSWHPHPDVWLLFGAIGLAYAASLKYLGPRLALHGEPVATRRQKVFFGLGLVALWAGADWPVHDLAEGYLYSVHMVQHFLFSLVAPPLLLLGMPRWLLRAMFRPPRVAAALRFLTKPVVALLLFNAILVITHWPALVDYSLRSEVGHFGIHLVLVGSALIMWWPVVSPLPEYARLTEPGKGLYLFLQSIVPTVPASFLTFADKPIYRFYEDVPRMGVSVVTDQRIAGLFMKIGGGLLLWTVIAFVFFMWNAREEKGVPEPEMTWDEFERELAALNLRKG